MLSLQLVIKFIPAQQLVKYDKVGCIHDHVSLKQLNLMVELTNINLRKAKNKISSKGKMKNILYFIHLLFLHSKTHCSNIILFDRQDY